MVLKMVYQLQASKNSSNFLKKPLGEDEKRDENVYLNSYHWDFLEELAEEQDISRNEALRRVLDTVIKETGGIK